jgi:hypothetical protein
MCQQESLFFSFGPEYAATPRSSVNSHLQFRVASCLKSALDRKTVSSVNLIVYCNIPRSDCKDETRARLTTWKRLFTGSTNLTAARYFQKVWKSISSYGMIAQ